MTSPIKGNFGHIREPGVLLLTKKDSDEKHKRNATLAGWSFLALFTVGIGSEPIAKEAKRERQIRHINKDVYPSLPYHACVLLRNHEAVIYNGIRYNNPYHADDMRKAEIRAYNDSHPEEVEFAEYKRRKEIPYQYTGSDFL